MSEKKSKINARGIALRAVGLFLCVIPVTVAILLYFPLWRARGGEVLLSGLTLLLLTLAALPLYKTIGILLRSPATYTVWLIAFILFLLLSKIADEMVVISFVGFIGNSAGAVFFKLAEEKRRE